MKKYSYALALCAFISMISLSCSKTAGNTAEDPDSIFTTSNNSQNESAAAAKGHLDQTVVGDLGADLTNLTFCSAKVVPICAGQTQNVGDVSVQTAVNGKTYITYTLRGLWYFKEIHLYAGDRDGIPVNGSGNPVPGQFPYTKSFTTPYNVQKYTFVIDGLDAAYTVAAHCSLQKISNGGNVIDEQTGWGDGCNGNRITTQGNWGTFMNYVSEACTISAAATEQVNICANNTDTYFWVNPANPTALTWRGPVTVGGFTYTEQEARAIANTASPNGTIPDSKYAFIRAATIKLSNTPFETSPSLAPAMKSIEDWLSTTGKLSPTNLPANNTVARNAASIIESWIASHLCSIE